jgi:UPF0755 protein
MAGETQDMRKPLAIAAALLALAVPAPLLALWIWLGLNTPARSAPAPGTFEVAEGETLASVSRRLEADGFLARRGLAGASALVGWARLRGVDRDIKSGEYEFEAGLTPLQILDRLVAGQVKTYAVTLPEGLRVDEVAARVEAAGIARADAFLARARAADLAGALGIEANSVEGYLYPETYRFRRNSDPDEIIRSMYGELQRRWTDADREALGASGMSLHQVVTLASIVEKETSVPQERALIAAVFRNRLALGMPLQTDPTVIYGVLTTRGSFDGNLRRRDLETDTAYNPYTRRGLPPGPIANPGMDSIRAVLAPAQVPYLYFVSRNDGTHVFSSTLADHNAAVRRHQLGR